jgi:glycosyltransferase involved in cell wall biosynthesis
VTEQHEPLVAVLTPVYNGEPYLAECIESVLGQSYRNWRYLIVNNRSTDRTLDIASEYAARDSRIRVVTNEQHLPVIANWNEAIRRLRGDGDYRHSEYENCDYCKIVHADDLLFPRCLEEMVHAGEANPSALVIGAYSLYGREVQHDGLPHSTTFLTGREVCRRSLLDRLKVFGSPTSTMFRFRVLRDEEPFYDETELHADLDACYRLLAAGDFAFVHQVLTFNRVHEHSITSSHARQLYTYRVANLSMIKKYGPLYLTAEEMEQCLARELDGYYRLLARHLLRRRDRKFWRYHRHELVRIEEPLKITKLALAWSGHMLDRLANPGSTLRGQLRKRLRTRS